jgi:hypothetical protein
MCPGGIGALDLPVDQYVEVEALRFFCSGLGDQGHHGIIRQKGGDQLHVISWSRVVTSCFKQHNESECNTFVVPMWRIING